MKRLALFALILGCGSPTDPAPSAAPARPMFSVLPALGPEDYTILYLPDTQFYSETYFSAWPAQVNWIAAHRDSLNIKFVSHLGDVVDNVTQDVEWQRASAAMAVLDSVVPLGIAAGNHDIDGNWANQVGRWTKYRSFFPAGRYSGKPYWGGYYHQNMAGRVSSYQKIVVGVDSLLFLHLEFQAPDDVLAWARGVVDGHPNHRVLVSTHSYLTPAGTRQATSTKVRKDGNQGSHIWDELIRRSPNIRWVHSGHLCGEGRAISTNDAGLPVHEIVTDYQCVTNGGDGWLRFYVVRPILGIVEAYTYSPTLNTWDTDTASQFVEVW